MARFLEFLGHNLGFPPSIDNVTTAELLLITPQDICRYFNVKAFNTETPTKDDLPIYTRNIAHLIW